MKPQLNPTTPKFSGHLFVYNKPLNYTKRRELGDFYYEAGYIKLESQRQMTRYPDYWTFDIKPGNEDTLAADKLIFTVTVDDNKNGELHKQASYFSKALRASGDMTSSPDQFYHYVKERITDGETLNAYVEKLLPWFKSGKQGDPPPVREEELVQPSVSESTDQPTGQQLLFQFLS